MMESQVNTHQRVPSDVFTVGEARKEDYDVVVVVLGRCSINSGADSIQNVKTDEFS